MRYCLLIAILLTPYFFIYAMELTDRSNSEISSIIEFMELHSHTNTEINRLETEFAEVNTKINKEINQFCLDFYAIEIIAISAYHFSSLAFENNYPLHAGEIATIGTVIAYPFLKKLQRSCKRLKQYHTVFEKTKLLIKKFSNYYKNAT